MKKLLYSSLAIAAMAVSCQEAELENNGAANNGEVFRISAALPETKTTLNPNDYTVAWESSDELTVIVNSNTAYKFTNAGGDNFEATGVALEDGTNTFHVLYPYSEFVYSVDENGVTCGRYGSKTYVSIPSEASETQAGLNNADHVKGVMRGYATVSSVEETPSITMNQLTALLKIDVKNDYGETINVQRINVSTDAKGELLSGTFYINLKNGTVESSGETYTHNYTILEVENGQIPAGATATFWVSANPFKVPAGSKLTISVDAEQGVVTDERTYEQELVFEAGTVNKTTFDYTTPSGIEKLTVAEFLAKPTGATYYELTGTIKEIRDSEYGSFILSDETGEVYVYGLTATKVASNDKSFATLGLREGYTVTICGTRDHYDNTSDDQKEQVGGPAYYISHVAVPYCDVTPSTLSVDAAEGTTTFAIESNESWEITSSNTSYTVSPESGEGDAEKITVTYPANETDEAITVTFTVTSESGEKTVTLTHRSASQIVNEKTETLSFVNWEFDGADSWTSSYEAHNVDFTIATVEFSSADKQNTGNTIDDCPVTKGQPVVLKMKGDATLSEVTVNLKQWASKSQTASIYTSTDGGATFSSEAVASSNNFVVSVSGLPVGVNAIQVKFSSSSNQVGIQSFDITYTE